MRKMRKLRATLSNIRLLTTKPLLNTMPRVVIVSPRLLLICQLSNQLLMSPKLYRSLNRFLTLFNYFFPPLNYSTTLNNILYSNIYYFIQFIWLNRFQNRFGALIRILDRFQGKFWTQSKPVASLGRNRQTHPACSYCESHWNIYMWKMLRNDYGSNRRGESSRIS